MVVCEVAWFVAMVALVVGLRALRHTRTIQAELCRREQAVDQALQRIKVGP